MGFDEGLKSFNADKIKPLYFVAAQDYFLTRVVVEEIKKALWPLTYGEANYQRLDGTEIKLVELLEAINTVPFFGKKRLVILENAGELISRLKTEEEEALRKYFSNPITTTTLVLVFDATNREKWANTNSRWVSKFKDRGQLVECKKPYEDQVPEWVKRIANSKGVRLTGEAIHYLSEQMGTDIQSIYSEMEKLEVHAKKGRPLTLEEVQNLVGDRRPSNIFAFQHSLGEGDLPAALLMLEKLFAEGEEGPRVLNRIFYYFRQLLLIKELARKGQENSVKKAFGKWAEEIAKITNTRSFSVNQRFLKASQNFSKEELLNAFTRILKADLEMKTSSLRPEDIIAPLVAELCKYKNAPLK